MLLTSLIIHKMLDNSAVSTQICTIFSGSAHLFIFDERAKTYKQNKGERS
jgi:hypothetical protein